MANAEWKSEGQGSNPLLITSILETDRIIDVYMSITHTVEAWRTWFEMMLYLKCCSSAVAEKTPPTLIAGEFYLTFWRPHDDPSHPLAGQWPGEVLGRWSCREHEINCVFRTLGPFPMVCITSSIRGGWLTLYTFSLFPVIVLLEDTMGLGSSLTVRGGGGLSLFLILLLCRHQSGSDGWEVRESGY